MTRYDGMRDDGLKGYIYLCILYTHQAQDRKIDTRHLYIEGAIDCQLNSLRQLRAGVSVKCPLPYFKTGM